ncbi:MAG: hypothetical protein LBK99_10945 [Opitutaceae bacterium]|jgi:hypothetical protein|nr:hypothetical protein [Opitutaceae bacterium]
MPSFPKSASSLIPAGVQGELIPLEELPDEFWAGEESDPVGGARYTAKRFKLRRPEDYRTCVELLAAGAGLLKIARLLKIHHKTVAAVRDDEGEQIDISKQRIRKYVRLAVEVGAERLADLMARLPDGQVAVPWAIAVDKLRDLEGEPTTRIQVTHKGHLTHESVLANLQSFPDVIDVEGAPSMGVDAGANEEKGAGAAAQDLSSGDS